MAVEKGPKLDWGITADVDLVGNFHKFVKLNTSTTVDTIVAVAATTDEALGVLNNAPLQGEEAEVVLSGIVKVLLGGTVAKGDKIGHDATGAGVTRTVGTDTTEYVYGRALEAGVAGQIISVAISTATAYLAK